MEFFDVYNDKKEKTGEKLPRKGSFLKEGQYQLIVLALLERPDHKFLITRRAMNKKWAAGDWEVSGGGNGRPATGRFRAAACSPERLHLKACAARSARRRDLTCRTRRAAASTRIRILILSGATTTSSTSIISILILMRRTSACRSPRRSAFRSCRLRRSGSSRRQGSFCTTRGSSRHSTRKDMFRRSKYG